MLGNNYTIRHVMLKKVFLRGISLIFIMMLHLTPLYSYNTPNRDIYSAHRQERKREHSFGELRFFFYALNLSSLCSTLIPPSPNSSALTFSASLIAGVHSLCSYLVPNLFSLHPSNTVNSTWPDPLFLPHPYWLSVKAFKDAI